MQQNRVKKILREGGLALSTHVGGIPDPQIVELIGLAGFDAAFIDMEHTTFDLHNVQAMVMASERIGVTPTAAISSICSTASMSSIMQASSASRFDCAMCSSSGVLPKLAARLPAAIPRSPSGG